MATRLRQWTLIAGILSTSVFAACADDPVKPGAEEEEETPIQPSNGVSDPTLLPAASGQRPASGSYGRTIAAGQTYQDPTTNVTVLKLTDASTPANNSGVDHGYSEGGPNISQPWTGTDGQVYYTLKVEGRLVDVKYSTLTAGNWRNQPSDGEIGFAFSLNPATPRIAYIVQDDRVNRYNTATNQVENTGSWPWVPTGGSGFQWLQNNLNDKWFVGMFNSNQTTVAFRAADGFRRTITQAQTGSSVDQPHIDRELPYVYIATDQDNRANTYVNLDNGTLKVPAQASRQSDDHVSPVRGMMVGLGHWEFGNMFYFNPLTDQTVGFAPASSVIGYPGDWHQAGQWVFNNGTGPAQWFVVDAWGSRDAEAAVQVGMIGIVRPSPFSARLVAAHDAVVNSYETQPQPTLAPDGKLVMWTSNMGGRSRTDVFVARMPVR